MSCVYLIYPNFYNYQTNSLSIGGVQTYFYYLSRVILSLNKTPIVYQLSTVDFTITFQGIKINGVRVDKRKDKKLALFNLVQSQFNPRNDIIIFGSENFSVKSKLKNVILIQHGVYWDLPISKITTNLIFDNFLLPFKRAYLRYKLKKNISGSINKVFVDYNYLNWYRTVSDITPLDKIWIVPNFAITNSQFGSKQIQEKHFSDSVVKILFARRFVELRGVFLLNEIIQKVSYSFSNVFFTIAGEGPLEEEIRKLDIYSNVRFIKYEPDSAFEIHKEHHIAIVPSLGSEGTSIAVAEAMSAGCVVVASNVGGITNMIFDGYNGLLSFPNSKEFVDKISSLIIDRKSRIKMATNALNVVTDCFSLEKWMNNWTFIFNSFNSK